MSTIASLIPYIIVKDANAAIAFYKAAFKATELFRMTDPKDGRVGHAELKFGESILMLADEYPDFGAVGPETIGGSPVTLHLKTGAPSTTILPVPSSTEQRCCVRQRTRASVSGTL